MLCLALMAPPLQAASLPFLASSIPTLNDAAFFETQALTQSLLNFLRSLRERKPKPTTGALLREDLLNRREFLAASIGLSIASQRLAAQEPPAPSFTPEQLMQIGQRFQDFLNAQKVYWSQSDKAEERDWAAYLDYAITVGAADGTTPISIRVEWDPTTRIIQRESPSQHILFHWVINPVFWNDMLNAMNSANPSDRASIEVLLRSLLVKEIGGAKYFEQHPSTFPALGWFLDWISSYRASYGAITMMQINENEPLRELIKIGNLLRLLPEAAGYYAAYQYLKAQPVDRSQEWKRLQNNPAWTPVSRNTLDRFYDPHYATRPNLENNYWELGVRHLNGKLNTPAPTMTDDLLLWQWAGLVEVAEGRAQLDEHGTILVPDEGAQTNFYPESFMAYLRDVSLYNITPQQLEERFGHSPPSPQTDLTGMRLVDKETASATPNRGIKILPQESSFLANYGVGLAGGAMGVMAVLGVAVGWFLWKRPRKATPPPPVPVPDSIIQVESGHDVYGGLQGLAVTDSAALGRVLQAVYSDPREKSNERIVFRFVAESAKEQAALERLGFVHRDNVFILPDSRARVRFLQQLGIAEEHLDGWKKWVMTEKEFEAVHNRVAGTQASGIPPGMHLERLMPAPPATSQKQWSHRVHVQFDLDIGRRDVHPAQLLELYPMKGFVRHSINGLQNWSKEKTDIPLQGLEVIGRTYQGNYLMAGFFDVPEQAEDITFNVRVMPKRESKVVDKHWVHTYKYGDARVEFVPQTDSRAGILEYIPHNLEFTWTGDVVFNPVLVQRPEGFYRRIRLSVQLRRNSFPIEALTDPNRIDLEVFAVDASGMKHRLENLKTLAQDLPRNYILEGELPVTASEGIPYVSLIVANRHHTGQEVKLTAFQQAELHDLNAPPTAVPLPRAQMGMSGMPFIFLWIERVFPGSLNGSYLLAGAVLATLILWGVRRPGTTPAAPFLRRVRQAA